MTNNKKILVFYHITSRRVIHYLDNIPDTNLGLLDPAVSSCVAPAIPPSLIKHLGNFELKIHNSCQSYHTEFLTNNTSTIDLELLRKKIDTVEKLLNLAGFYKNKIATAGFSSEERELIKNEQNYYDQIYNEIIDMFYLDIWKATKISRLNSILTSICLVCNTEFINL
jgi:hypothetical protein